MKRISPRVFAIGLMLALLLSLTVALTASASAPWGADTPDTPTASWKLLTQTTPFAWTRFDAETLTIGGKPNVCVLGGRDGANNTDGTIYCSVDGTTWNNMGTMIVPVSNYEIAKLTAGGHVCLYIFGGRDNLGNIVTDVQFVCDNGTIGEDTAHLWPGTTDDSACVSFAAEGVTVVNNEAYVVGGFTSNTTCFQGPLTSKQTWKYNPTSGWTQGGDLTQSRGYVTLVSATTGGKTYLIAAGGDTWDGASLIAQTTVDISTDLGVTWKAGPPLPEACDEAQGFITQKKFLFAGCGQWPNTLPDSWVLDPTTKMWTPGPALNQARRNHAGVFVTVGGKATPLVIGGYDTSGFTTLNTMELLTGTLLGQYAPSSRSAAGAAPNATTY